jgi:DNA-binding IclR family transcriptional regulator
MKTAPPYPLTSVDNALLLLHLLRDQGSLRVSEAAEALGTSPSTAHRLLSMLVFRDFAVQADDRSYHPGPGLNGPPHDRRPLQRLRRIMLPHMELLAEQVDETVNLVVRIGVHVRFIATVESTQVLRVGDRQGSTLPAHLASGGKAMLAAMDDDEVRTLYNGGGRAAARDVEPVDVDTILTELRAVRRRGYAVNREATERGVSAIGMCITAADGDPVAGLSIAMPTARFPRHPAALHRALSTTVMAVRPELTPTAESVKSSPRKP